MRRPFNEQRQENLRPHDHVDAQCNSALGDTTEYNWATGEYSSLLNAVNQTLDNTISTYGLNYLPCSMVAPNDNNRCSNPKDANWAAPFLFDRWACDGYLFDAPISGAGHDLIDATYDYGFGRLKGILPPGTYGGTALPRMGLNITTNGTRVTLTLSGSSPAGPVLFQLPAFVNNIASSTAGAPDEATGTVTLPTTARTVTVTMTHPAT